MNCTLCDKPVVLHPTAAQRAERYGGTPREYTILFPRHADCELKAREQGTQELTQRLNSDEEAPHMQTISRVGGIITKAAACQAARQEFARQFQTMAASMGYWHLYACRGGLVIAQMGEPDPELVLLVANVHAGTVEQVVNSLCHQLDREGTPPVWVEGRP